MGRALSAIELLTQALELLELARTASDPDLRNRYIKLATELTALASQIDAEPTVAMVGMLLHPRKNSVHGQGAQNSAMQI